MTASGILRDRPIARPLPCGAFQSLMCGIGANRPGGGSTCYEVGTVDLFFVPRRRSVEARRPLHSLYAKTYLSTRDDRPSDLTDETVPSSYLPYTA